MHDHDPPATFDQAEPTSHHVASQDDHDGPVTPDPTLSTYMVRLLGVIGLGLFFTITSSVFEPGQSSASSISTDVSRPPSTEPSVAETSPPVLGRLKGNQYEFVIRAHADGPRIDVRALDCSVVESGLTLDEVAIRFTDAPIDALEGMAHSTGDRIGIVDTHVPLVQP